ncbi:MAG TPA: putative DNA modification/repair radical SAM protein [Candidatus Wallbacteria bacterium]|nr:MAG: Radical SAM superfamily protein [bacterium ADurb.Bin243]HOD39309.1 putative DNA modification/repair radical SAM protein [Candidatus Wallbacteria bacterium]HPG56264.1 putative DNA modification/repair radical SAM protein [Candidatus Wallbacteria bacterium]
MDVKDKLKILSAAAKYDVSCVSSGSSRQNTEGGIGNAAESGICHTWGADGRCVSLLKVLLTNNCIYNCAYCINRTTNDVPRASFTVDEIVDLTINFYIRNYIEGLFLSSGVEVNANYTMERMLLAVKKLRIEKKFNGYIHLKAIPGADYSLVSEAGRYADRMSVNIELPSEESLKALAPQKNRENILLPMKRIGAEIIEKAEEHKKNYKAPQFVPAGQSTQLIIGASPEPDYKIIKLSESLYDKFNLKRVFYSAYIPVSDNPKLPVISKPPLLREHRLYQADWLLRFYGFLADELVNPARPQLDAALDPKAAWAVNNLHLFPVEINRASYETILRIPGVGVRSAKKIVTARRVHALNFDDLKRLGVVLKRAKYFITCSGKYYEKLVYEESSLRVKLIGPPPALPGSGAAGLKKKKEDEGQLSLFENDIPHDVSTNISAAVTGEF